MKTTKVMVAVLLLLGVSVATADAQQRRGWRGGGPSPRYYNHGPRYNGGDAIGGFVGGILGGVIGGVVSPFQQPGPVYVNPYCQQRFRSYDPYTASYLGFDGFRHPCP